MGAGIAQAFLVAGARVEVVEAGAEAAEAARGRVADGLEEAARRGKLTGDVGDTLARLDLVDSAADLSTATGLVVEAVPEQADLKITVLTAAETALGPDAVLATNTSSLSITELAAALDHPARFLGMHFFNPVPGSKLVEVVIGPATGDPDAGGGRRGRGLHRRRHGAGLRAPHGPAPFHGPRGPGRTPGHRRIPAPHPRRTVRAPATAARQGGARRAGPQDGPRIPRLGLTGSTGYLIRPWPEKR